MRLTVFLCFLLATGITYAAQAPMTLEKQIRESDRIIRARVLHTSCRAGVNEFGDHLLFTDVSLRTEEALKGDRSDVLLTVEGGTVNGITMEASDTPRFREGEEIVVFIKSGPALNTPFGGLQSKHTIAADGYLLPEGISYRIWKVRILSAIAKQTGVRK